MNEVPRTRGPEGHDYYTGYFWNGLPLVQAYLQQRISGDPEVNWPEHFARTVGRTFDRAFILGCGDGRIERHLVDAGLVASAVGVDADEAVLEQARAAVAGRSISYLAMDFNDELPDGPFDLVVNHAAAHHVTYVDRVFRGMCERLEHDGWLVAYDYVGPHRNQVPAAPWFRSVEVNAQLPDDLQKDMLFAYPHLPTMIAVDPTEAVHSELVPDVMRRYFDVVDDIGLGGTVAYQLLTHNEALHTADPEVRDAATAIVLAADDEYLRAHPESTFFSYVTARPNHASLDDTEQLARWTAEEDARERDAAANGGEYYEHELLAELYMEMERRRVTAVRAQEQLGYVQQTGATSQQTLDALQLRLEVTDLTNQLAELRSSRSWRITAPFARARRSGSTHRSMSSALDHVAAGAPPPATSVTRPMVL